MVLAQNTQGTVTALDLFPAQLSLFQNPKRILEQPHLQRIFKKI
jgi:hypothetical protein